MQDTGCGRLSVRGRRGDRWRGLQRTEWEPSIQIQEELTECSWRNECECTDLKHPKRVCGLWVDTPSRNQSKCTEKAWHRSRRAHRKPRMTENKRNGVSCRPTKTDFIEGNRKDHWHWWGDNQYLRKQLGKAVGSDAALQKVKRKTLLKGMGLSQGETGKLKKSSRKKVSHSSKSSSLPT